MMTPPNCPHCKTPMKQGFQTDHTYGEVKRSTWTEGKPERLKVAGLNFGIKGAEGAEILPITLFRCPLCGYLESYALPAEPSKK